LSKMSDLEDFDHVFSIRGEEEFDRQLLTTQGQDTHTQTEGGDLKSPTPPGIAGVEGSACVHQCRKYGKNK
ncbi:hypothetical protein L9F63_012389, partial [Diploptera punctata]